MVKPYTDLEEMKRDLQSSENTEEKEATFKTEMNVWEDRPKINASEEVKSSTWTSSAHYLTKMELIMHAVPSQDDQTIQFVFYEIQAPFKETKRYEKIKREHFESVMIATDQREEELQDEDCFLAVL